LVCPAPVPEVADSSDRVVEGQVAHSKLLVSESCTDLASIKDKVTCKTGRAYIIPN
jgi:hypothetical protein